MLILYCQEKMFNAKQFFFIEKSCDIGQIYNWNQIMGVTYSKM